MIPILFEKGETYFMSNGIGRLTDAMSCEVTQERNGIYELAMTYPVSGRHYADILSGIEENSGEYGRVIYTTHDTSGKPQAFDLYKHTAPLNGLVTFYAHHVSYRLSKQVLMPFTATSAQQAFLYIERYIVGGSEFSFYSDKTTTTNFVLAEPRTVKQQLGGISGSMLDAFNGGDYEFDMFSVKLMNHLGRDTGIQIRYGKNLTDLTQDYDIDKCYNAVVPYWRDQEGTIVTIPGRVVSVHEELGQDMQAVPLDLSDKFEAEPTTEQMTAAALAYLRNNTPWIPNENLKIQFELYTGDEYYNVRPLMSVKLFDTVDVIYQRLGVNAIKKRVIKVVYDSLLEKYKSMELGEPAKSISTAIADSVEGKVLQVVPSRREVRDELDNATAQITGATNSHVRFIYDSDGGLQEIVIMDTEDIDTAQNVWRFNSGGLGHSSTGYAGPYTTAITQDGEIVADVIKTGLLSDRQGKSYWNLLTGVMNIVGSFTSTQTSGTRRFIMNMIAGALLLKTGPIASESETEVGRIEWSQVSQQQSGNINYYDVMSILSTNGNGLVLKAIDTDSVDALIQLLRGAVTIKGRHIALDSSSISVKDEDGYWGGGLNDVIQFKTYNGIDPNTGLDIYIDHEFRFMNGICVSAY